MASIVLYLYPRLASTDHSKKNDDQKIHQFMLNIASGTSWMADENAAYNLYQQGRFFESSPLFEKYKFHRPKLPDDFDVSKAGDDLVEIMELENKYLAEHPVEQPQEGEFAEEPYDHYEELRNAMLEFFPDFKLRLKLNPITNRIVLSADVNSVFEIAWYALAHLMTEEPLPAEKGKQVSRPEGMMTCCKNCGRFFIRRNYRNEYCEHFECQKARNAKNQREFRDRRKIEKTHPTGISACRSMSSPK